MAIVPIMQLPFILVRLTQNPLIRSYVHGVVSAHSSTMKQRRGSFHVTSRDMSSVICLGHVVPES